MMNFTANFGTAERYRTGFHFPMLSKPFSKLILPGTNRGIAICAPIAPYASTRRHIRQIIEQYGGFIEVHVGTPVEICENRDRKGLYAKARAGLIKEFTGVSDPYEIPENPEDYIDTTDMTPDEAAQEVLLYLERAGYTWCFLQTDDRQ